MAHVTCSVIQVTCHMLSDTNYMLQVTWHMSHVTCYMSHLHDTVTCYMLHVRCVLMHVFKDLKKALKSLQTHRCLPRQSVWGCSSPVVGQRRVDEKEAARTDKVHSPSLSLPVFSSNLHLSIPILLPWFKNWMFLFKRQFSYRGKIRFCLRGNRICLTKGKRNPPCNEFSIFPLDKLICS